VALAIVCGFAYLVGSFYLGMRKYRRLRRTVLFPHPSLETTSRT
jgi:hypothetical protein